MLMLYVNLQLVLCSEVCRAVNYMDSYCVVLEEGEGEGKGDGVWGMGKWERGKRKSEWGIRRYRKTGRVEGEREGQKQRIIGREGERGR